MTTHVNTNEEREVEKGTLAVNVNEAARLLGLGRHTTWGLIRTRKLRAIRVGRRWIVPRGELVRFLSQHDGQNEG